MAAPLEHRHALVTGGSRGIGRAIAAALTQAGTVVTVVARDKNALDDVLASGDAAHALAADVTRRTEVDAAILAAEAAGGPVDLLIANAGAAQSAPFGRSDPGLFQHVLDVNLFGAIHPAQGVLPGMVARGFGRIVVVASTAGLKGYPYVTAYCAAKHAVVGLVRALAQETARTGVTVNAVCPGFADTDLTTQSVRRLVDQTGRTPQDALAELTRHNPQRRLIQPAEIADAVLWLCGNQAGAINGQAIAVAGGEI